MARKDKPFHEYAVTVHGVIYVAATDWNDAVATARSTISDLNEIIVSEVELMEDDEEAEDEG